MDKLGAPVLLFSPFGPLLASMPMHDEAHIWGTGGAGAGAGATCCCSSLPSHPPFSG